MHLHTTRGGERGEVSLKTCQNKACNEITVPHHPETGKPHRSITNRAGWNQSLLAR